MGWKNKEKTEKAEKGIFRKINKGIKRPSICENFEIRDLIDCFIE